jgi:hypothetical protein
MLDGLRLPVYEADDGAALRHPLHVGGGEIPRRRRERSAGNGRQEGVTQRGFVEAIGAKDKQVKFSEDGSLTVYVQHDSPGAEKEGNCCPRRKDRSK